MLHLQRFSGIIVLKVKLFREDILNVMMIVSGEPGQPGLPGSPGEEGVGMKSFDVFKL